MSPKATSSNSKTKESQHNTQIQNVNALKGNSALRTTPTHIIFYHGILSNWHLKSPPFPGDRALTLCLPELQNLGVPHPSQNAFLTRLIRSSTFNCGEQWMMAMKAWLFEGIPDMDSLSDISDEEFAVLKEIATASEQPSGDPERAVWESTVCAVLRAKSPRTQKALGRCADGFREDVWGTACEAIVTAGCVARAEVDGELKGIYLAGSGRRFVEGSVSDRIWGVGLSWTGSEIEDEGSWKGENRLGRCHDEAARIVRLAD
jgi:ribA/ribD-fused uncharacterized protein